MRKVASSNLTSSSDRPVAVYELWTPLSQVPRFAATYAAQ